MMKLTIEELKEIIKNVLEKLDEEGMRGVDGYVRDEDHPVEPRGFGESEAFQMHNPLSNNLYKRQGAAHFGPLTSESMVREVVKNIIREKFEMKSLPKNMQKSSAPFNRGQMTNASHGLPEWKRQKKVSKESAGRWYDLGKMAEKRNKFLKKMESNILANVYSERSKK